MKRVVISTVIYTVLAIIFGYLLFKINIDGFFQSIVSSLLFVGAIALIGYIIINKIDKTLLK